MSSHALLIGINRYTNLDPKYELGGCVNDVELMHSVLTTHLGFAKESIQMLKDETATQAAIREAMTSLAERVNEDDIVYFHFSGHGSWREPLTEDEGTGRDSTIMPSDSGRNPLPNLDISDKEMGEWVDGLAKKTRFLTLVFDCCHSGTMTRDPFAGTARGVPGDNRSIEAMSLEPRPELYRNVKQRSVGDDAMLPLDDAYIVISGCRNNETSKELLSPLPRCGALTYHLAQAMSKQPSATYREVFDFARQRITEIYPTQHPQMQGPQDRQLFGTSVHAVNPFILVSSVENTRVTIDAGSLHGVQADSLWAVFPANTRVFAGVSPMGELRIDAVLGLEAEGQYSGSGAIQPGCRCMLVSNPAGTFRLPVLVESSEDETQQKLVAAIELSPLLVLATDPLDAQIKLSVTQLLQLTALTKEGEPAFSPIELVDEPNIKEAVRNLEAISKARNVLALDNPGGAVNVKVTLFTSSDGNSWQPLEGEDIVEGDLMAFEIENLEAESAVFVSLISIGLKLDIDKIYPPNKASELIERGDKLRIGFSRQKFRLRFPSGFAKSTGRQGIKVIVSTEEVEVGWLEQQGTRSAGGAMTTLHHLFNTALHGAQTRDFAEETSADWVSINRTLILNRKGDVE